MKKMFRINDSNVWSLAKRWQFKPKGHRAVVPLHVPPTCFLSTFFSPPFLNLVFFTLFFSPVLCLLFSFSLITLYLPFSTHCLHLPSLWHPFIRSKPHFRHSSYSGRPFSLQMPSLCRIKALVQNQFSLPSIMFFLLYSPFTQVFFSSQLIVFCSWW